MPAMSTVRNVALFGRPMAGPVIASISSIVYPSSERLRPGAEDLHDAVEADAIGDEVRRVLRRNHALSEAVVGESATACSTAGSVSGVRNDLDQTQVARRVEEMRAERSGALKRADRPATMAAIGMPDVLELTIASARRCRSTRAKQRLLDVEALDDGFDDPVGRGDRGEVLVEAAGADERGASGVKNGSGLSLRARARVPRARRPRVTSSSSTGTPALAKCAAICAPIVPAPSTAAVRMRVLTLVVPLLRRRACRCPSPPTNTSTIASASAASEYLRRLRIQLVAISSSAPKNSLAASVGLISRRNARAPGRRR